MAEREAETSKADQHHRPGRGFGDGAYSRSRHANVVETYHERGIGVSCDANRRGRGGGGENAGYLAIRCSAEIGPESRGSRQDECRAIGKNIETDSAKILSRENRECVLLTNKRRDGLVQYSMRRSITDSRQIDEPRASVGIDVGGIHAPHERIADGPPGRLV